MPDDPVTPLPDILALTPLDAPGHRWRAPNLAASGNPVVFGGQLLAQGIVAAASVTAPEMSVRSIHAIFARPALAERETELAATIFHAGRSFATTTIVVSQNDRPCAHLTVLSHTPDGAVVDHDASIAPAVAPPAEGTRDHAVFPGGEYVIADGVDLMSSAAPAGPAELTVWYRHTTAPDDLVVQQAVLAWGTDGFSIGTAMRPHEGVAYDRAHVDLSTGVIGHTLTFHRPFSMREWVQMSLDAPVAADGRSHGRCLVHDTAGRVIASFVQDNMIRPMPDRGGM